MGNLPSHSLRRDEIVELRHALVDWGGTHFRTYPWRLTEDPYRILIAEVMLHRTQVAQVVPVYEEFIDRYPSIRKLAMVRLPELHKILRPLGLHWRIRLLHRMVQELTNRHTGKVPRDKNALKDLPGVSEYIASAVRCFAWNLPEILLDTNTIRVVSKLFGLPLRDYSRRSALYRRILTELLDSDQPRAFNFALLDLADALCSARRPPLTHICPLREWCNHALSHPVPRTPKPWRTTPS